jgi:hypothetical protein
MTPRRMCGTSVVTRAHGGGLLVMGGGWGASLGSSHPWRLVFVSWMAPQWRGNDERLRLGFER